MQVETVKIVRGDSPRGFRIIAASDFDEKVHTLFEGEQSASSANKTTAKPRPKRRPRKAAAEK